MLTEPEVRAHLTAAASRMNDDSERAWRAITIGHRVLVRRRRMRIGFAAIGLIACVGAVPAMLDRDHVSTAPTAATVACLPDRTMLSTHRLVSLRDGAQITIVNRTSESVVVQLGNETAVIAPGTAEGQYPLVAGRHEVRCESQSRASAPATLAVFAPRHA